MTCWIGQTLRVAQSFFWPDASRLRNEAVVATATALALAIVLCIFARFIGGHWPHQQQVLDYTGADGILNYYAETAAAGLRETG